MENVARNRTTRNSAVPQQSTMSPYPPDAQEAFSIAGEKLQRIVGVFHADGDFIGEMRYLSGFPLRGTTDTKAHCALCNITHGGITVRRVFTCDFSPKSDWKLFDADFQQASSLEFQLDHRDEQEPELRKVTDGHTACVGAQRKGSDEWFILMDKFQLERCEGKVQKFIELFKLRIVSL